MDKTIEYYNLYAEDYVNTTQSVDFHLIQERFLSALKAAFPKVCKKMDYKKELQEIIDQVESAKNRLAEVTEAMDFDDREVIPWMKRWMHWTMRLIS